MIKAKHSLWADRIFKPYIFRLLKKNFNSICVIGEIPIIPQNMPLILIPNHSTWWDGFFVYLLNKKFFNRKFYIMILEEQLSQFKFFTKLGGFSISKNSLSSINESLKYTAEILKNEPFSITTIFPQGELLPNYTRPLFFNRGIEMIVRFSKKDVCLLPLSMRIEYLKEEKPSVFFKFGEPIIANEGKKFYSDILQTEVENGLEFIAESILNNNYGNIILNGKISISEKSKNTFGLSNERNN